MTLTGSRTKLTYSFGMPLRVLCAAANAGSGQIDFTLPGVEAPRPGDPPPRPSTRPGPRRSAPPESPPIGLPNGSGGGKTMTKRILSLFLLLMCIHPCRWVWLRDRTRRQSRASATTAPTPTATVPTTPEPTPTPDPVQARLDAMTTEEKVGQLLMAGFEGHRARRRRRRLSPGLSGGRTHPLRAEH